MSEVDALASRLTALQRTREEVTAEEAHVQAELVRKLREQLLEQSVQLEKTRLQLARARDALTYSPPLPSVARDALDALAHRRAAPSLPHSPPSSVLFFCPSPGRRAFAFLRPPPVRMPLVHARRRRPTPGGQSKRDR